MSSVRSIFVVRPIERFYTTALRIIFSHEPASELYFVSLNSDGKIMIERNGKHGIYSVQSFKEFLIEVSPSALYMDNYLCKENIKFLRYCKNAPLFILNYGVYFCKDEISYTFARYFKITPFLKFLTSCKLLIRDIHLSYIYGKIHFGLRDTFYARGTVIFWNNFSKLNFEKAYPLVKTKLININAAPSRVKSEGLKILVSPSILGGRKGKAGHEELHLWKGHLERIRSSFSESIIHLSLHPVYVGKYKEELINHGIVEKVYVGIPAELVSEYDIVFTDVSTLFWVAQSYSIKAFLLEGYKIPDEFFNPLSNKKDYF